jgi:small subunit ribosomal protein S4
LGVQNKPSSVLNFIYENYQNNFKYRKLLKTSSKKFFFSKKREKFLYKVTSDDKEFKRKRRTVKIDNYLNLLKLRRFYGSLGERKFKRDFKALAIPLNVVSRSFAYFLESRLDVVLYRSNLFKSIFAARQYINHRKVYINGSIVSIPSYRMSVGDVITVSNPSLLYEDIKQRLILNKILNNYPRYLEVNYKLGMVVLIRLPINSEIPYPFFMDVEAIASSFNK